MKTTPSVSVIMANRNGAPYLRAAIASVLCQSCDDLELILSDDGSVDESLAIAEAAAEHDQRLRIEATATARGPATARNRAIDVARGDWIAIVDSDDLIHPRRLERMLSRAQTLDADVVADDLIYFGANTGRTLLDNLGVKGLWMPTNAEFLAAEMARPPVPVGYLKPIIRRVVLGELRYRTYMTVGEDFDLLFRVLLGGARLAVLPEAYYLYRRHAHSISHRLSEAAAAGMVRATLDLVSRAPDELRDLLEQRRRMHLRAEKFAALVQRLKGPDRSSALRMLVDEPALVLPLARAGWENFGRKLRGQDAATTAVRLSLLGEGSSADDAETFRKILVPEGNSGWTPARAAHLAAVAGAGPLTVRAHGRAGLEALGYLPGWDEAELFPPTDGWTDRERRRIAALPWHVTMH